MSAPVSTAHPTMARRFILCDLDGTLVDSAPDLAAALNRLLAGAGRNTLAQPAVRRFIGDGTRKLVERGFAATGAPLAAAELDAALARFMADYSAHATDSTRPYPGVVETLERLREDGVVLGLCTNKPEGATRSMLEALGLAAFFSGISAGDSCAARKPDPGHVLDALARIDADPARTAMVGDSEHDIAAGRAAGLKTIVVTYGYAREPYATMGATRMIGRFDELPAALAAMGL
jgi:phosphoglycolate phosphatase